LRSGHRLSCLPTNNAYTSTVTGFFFSSDFSALKEVKNPSGVSVVILPLMPAS